MVDVFWKLHWVYIPQIMEDRLISYAFDPNIFPHTALVFANIYYTTPIYVFSFTLNSWMYFIRL